MKNDGHWFIMVIMNKLQKNYKININIVCYLTSNTSNTYTGVSENLRLLNLL